MASPLSSENLIVRGPGRTRLTEKGRAVAAVPESVPTLDDYHNMLRTRLRQLKTSKGKSLAMLDLLIENGFQSITTEQIGQAVGVDHTGGYFSNSIGPLSTLGLITRNRGTVEPTEILFPPGLE